MIDKRHVWITASEIRRSMNTVYIYGGNLAGYGEGGQALVAFRFQKIGKSFPIPTKITPERNLSAYFSDQDNEIQAVKDSFKEIKKFIKQGKKIVFFPGIGEGRAELPKRSPIIHKMIQDFIARYQKLDVEKLRGKKE